MNLMQRTVADLVRVLARRLRIRLTTPSANGNPVFRDRTLTKLRAALAEAAPQLDNTPAAPAVFALAEGLAGLTPADLRRSAVLRTQIAGELAVAETNLKTVIPSPWKETRP